MEIRPLAGALSAQVLGLDLTAEIAEQLGVTGQTIYNWRNQDLVDRGLRPGVSTAESVELAAARGRIHELETELAVTKRAFELLKEQTDPKELLGGLSPTGVVCRAARREHCRCDHSAGQHRADPPCTRPPEPVCSMSDRQAPAHDERSHRGTRSRGRHVTWRACAASGASR